jgi:hypothetical protein
MHARVASRVLQVLDPVSNPALAQALYGVLAIAGIERGFERNPGDANDE